MTVTLDIKPGGGGTYTSFILAHAAIPSDPTEEYVLELQEAVISSESAIVDITVSNTGLETIRVTCAAGFRFTDDAAWPAIHANGGGITVSGDRAVRSNTPNVIVEYLYLTQSSASNVNGVVAAAGNGPDAWYRYCLIRSTSRYGIYSAGSATGRKASYCMIWDASRDQVHTASGADISCYHVTAVGVGTAQSGFRRAAGTFSCDNCIAVHVDGSGSWTNSAYRGTPTGDYNLADDTSAPGANSFQSVAAGTILENIGSGTEDFHRDSALTSSQYRGVDQSADAGSFDIDGDAVNTFFNVGADEAVGTDYTITVVTEFAISQGLATVEVQDIGFFDSIASDLDLIDGRVLISIERKGSQTLNALAGRVEVADVTVLEAYAVKSMVTERDLMQANAAWRAADTRFRMAAEDVTFSPLPGDRLTLGTEVWDVLGTNLQVGETQVMIWCRRV